METKLSYEDTASVGFEEVIREECRLLIACSMTSHWTISVRLCDQVNVGRDAGDKSLIEGDKSGLRCIWRVTERTRGKWSLSV